MFSSRSARWGGRVSYFREASLALRIERNGKTEATLGGDCASRASPCMRGHGGGDGLEFWDACTLLVCTAFLASVLLGFLYNKPIQQ